MTASAHCSLIWMLPRSALLLICPRILPPCSSPAFITTCSADGRRCRVALTPRRALFWLHLTAGVTAGTVIFFLAVTGACLAYQRQMIAWADRGQHVSESGARQSLQTLLESAQKYAHAPATAIAIHS